MPPREKTSIYQEPDERPADGTEDNALSYMRKGSSTSYETGAEILRQIGWRPTAAYGAI